MSASAPEATVRPVLHDFRGLPESAGAYALLLALPAPLDLPVPGPRGGRLTAGAYAYFGNANGPGGIAARVGRHLRADKRARWHIDRLRLEAEVTAVAVWPGGDECAWRAAVQAVQGASVPLKGFGSSDCRSCPAHLLALAEDTPPGALVAGVGASSKRA